VLIHHRYSVGCYGTLHKASDRYFGTKQAVVKGNEVYIGFRLEDLKETDHLRDHALMGG
jgi:hypothetical protein